MRYAAELPFSPLFDFVWMRGCTLNGVEVQAGDPVDKTQIDERRLRVLFQTRKIRPAGFEDGVKPAYLEHGRGAADKIARQIKQEEEQTDAPSNPALPAQKGRADAKKAAAAAQPAAAETVERRGASPSRGRARSAKRAA